MLSAHKYGNRKWYWRLFLTRSRIRHIILSFLYRQRMKAHRSRETFSIFHRLTSLTLPVFLIAILFILCFEVSEWAILRLSGCLQFIPLDKLAEVISMLRRLASQNDRVATTILTVLASTSSLFLGLYFTAISIVLSSSFAHSPNNMRNLLLNERVGNRYIKALAILTVACIVVLSLRAFGYQTSATTLIAVSLLGCFSVFCFLVLGIRAFSFFDPMELCRVVFGDLMLYIRGATVYGNFWDEPAFQSHYHKLATGAVEQLETLMVLVGADANLKRESGFTVLRHTIYSLGLYVKHRSRIPTQSYWYTRIPRHKNWFLQDDTVLNTALATQTGIQPELVADPYWIETQLDESIAELLVNLTKPGRRRELGAIQAFLEASSDYFEIKGIELESEHGVAQFRSMTQPILKFALTLTQEDDRDVMVLATLDTYLFASMSLFIGFAKVIRSSSIEGIKGKINSIDWTNPSSVYKQSFPPPILPIVEDLQSRLRFEVATEDRLITPNWYILQLVAMEYSKLLYTSLEVAFDVIEQNILTLAESFNTKSLWSLAAVTANRGLEAISKVGAHMDTLRELIKSLESLSVEKELKWQEWDWDAHKKRCGDINQKCIDVLTIALPGLSMLEHDAKIPDSFGQAYNVICQRCYEYLTEGNAEAFARALPSLFLGALSAHNKIRALVKDYIPIAGTTLMLEPLVDIMELCGYARVYSELLNIPVLWNVCQATWDRYLSTKKTPEQRKDILKFLITSYEYRRDAYGMYPRDLLRTRWQIRLNAVLRDRGLIGDHFIYKFYKKQPTVNHKSHLIRALCRGGYELHISGSDIFLATYLTKLKGAEGIAYQDRWDLHGQIDREENRGRDNDG